MKLCCMMMQKDEDRLLDTWLRFYESLVGPDAIFVWDNGSTSEATIAYLKGAEERGVRIFWDKSTPQDFETKNMHIGSLIKEFDSKNKFDFFLPLDCDEFLAVRLQNEVRCDRETIFSTFEKYQTVEGPLKIAGSYYNIPTADRGFFFWKEDKVMFRAGTFASTDLGFHHGATISGDPEFVTDFIHLHFQHKPLQTLLRHARNKLKLRVKDFSAESLAAYTGPGSHLSKYFAMTEDDYLKSFDVRNAIKVPAFEEALASIGAAYPFAGEF